MEKYIYWFVSMVIIHREDEFILDEMISHWDFTAWSKHVPNDALDEVIAIIKQCAEAYYIMVDYLIPESLLLELRECDCSIKVTEQEYTTTVEIT